MIEGIEDLGAEINIYPLGDSSPLKNPEIDVLKAVLPQHVAAKVSIGVRNYRNSVSIKPVVRSLLEA